MFLLFGLTKAQMDRSDSSNTGCGPMMGMGMMMPRVVSTMPDGSVLVISGHKLIKYDQNLNLVKQVTIPVDSASMQQMRKMCPNPPESQKAPAPPKGQKPKQ